ncbi:MAG TPA: hypothetical protein VK050_05810 [Flavobacteriaceae bacterium]|nr:hypothetical protein [Flavobacteriaceae bacterium]
MTREVGFSKLAMELARNRAAQILWICWADKLLWSLRSRANAVGVCDEFC